MENNIGIKTFVRVDQAMIDLLLPEVITGHQVEDHWGFWVFNAKTISPKIKEWLACQPSDSWAVVRFTSAYQRLIADPEGTRIAVGVSLSQVTPEQIRQMLDSRKPISIIEVETGLLRYTVTKNPNIYTADRDFFYVPRFVGQGLPEPIKPSVSMRSSNTELEQKFKDSLNGHDFWYDYSDSLSVWRAGEARTKDLKDAGIAMGLSRSDVDRLYDEKYKELTKG